MIRESDLTIVGRVNKTHGIDGEMSVSFIDPDVADVVEVGTCVFFKIEGIMVPFFIDTVRPRGAESRLVSLDGEDSQELVSQFVGMDIYMRTADLPEADDSSEGFFAAQLIGFKAIDDEDGSEIGEITDIDDSTDNPLFIVTRPDASTVYLPIVDEMITDIDVQERTISFELPEGILDL